MIERIKNGTRPTEILKEIREKNPKFQNYDLAIAFFENLGGISGEATQAIWHWKNGREKGGFEDEELDQILIGALKEAGYV